MQLRSTPGRPALAGLAVAVAVAATGACGSRGSSGPGSGRAIEVVSTKTECKAASTALAAGRHTFKVVNKGDQPTELYVLEQGGKVVGEVENVGPGTSRTLSASLKAGQYELSCKPGQTGDGIRQVVTVTGAGGAGGAGGAEGAAASYDREVALVATDFAYTGTIGEIKVGQAIEFKLKNEGGVEHEFEVSGPGPKVVGEIGPTRAGATGQAVLQFTQAGTYTYTCGIGDHQQRGMTGTFVVT